MDGTADEDAAGFIQAAINQIEQNSLKRQYGYTSRQMHS